MQKKTQTYIIDDTEYLFDKATFRNTFNLCRKEYTISEFEQIIANEVGVGTSTIHSWRVGDNAPSDLEKIKDLASSLNLSSYDMLLKKKEAHVSMQITERQKDSIKRIYDSIIEFFDSFDQTNGFNDLWHRICNQYDKARDIEDELYNIADYARHKCEVVLQKEYIELFRLDIYEKLEEYIYDYMLEMYAEKLTYAYRFEAGVEKIDGTRDTLTTEEELTKAYKTLHEIIEPYM